MTRPKFDPNNPDRELVRRVVIRRLQEDHSWREFSTIEGFQQYVEIAPNSLALFGYLAREVWWQLLCTGILAPGYEPNNDDLPGFHLTPLGEVFIQTGEWPIYHPDTYLARLKRTIPNPDSTVLAYLVESLRSFESANFVASALMIGIAAERAFILLCESTLNALGTPNEKADFKKKMDRYMNTVIHNQNLLHSYRSKFSITFSYSPASTPRLNRSELSCKTQRFRRRPSHATLTPSEPRLASSAPV